MHMIKNNLKLLASALGFVLFFYACRTDEMVNFEQRTQNERIQAFERFENLRSHKIQNSKISYSKGGDPLSVSYAQPFSEIIYNFLISHPDFQEKLFNDFGDIDYNVASQTFGTDKKYIFYPILKEGKVTALWYGKLNEDRSWVDFYLVNDSSASTQRMIGEFQAYYSKNTAARGASDPPVIEIPEIILTPPSTNPPIHDPIYVTGGGGGGDFPPPPYTGDMSGGPMLHGGGTRAPQDPCKKAQSIYNDTAIKSRYEQLKGKVGNTSETGYGFKKVSDGNGGITTQTNPLDPDAVDPDHMKLGIYATTFGYSHTHLNKNGTEMSVKIFSPADINAFLTILHNANQNNVPLNTVFGGMVASDPDTLYNIYQIQYTGDGTDLPAEFTEQQLKKLKADYTKIAQDIVNSTGELTHSDLQELFFATLKKMNIKNTILFKIQGNVVKKVDYNENGILKENPCS